MISVNFRDPRPIYEQIKDNLRRLIVTGLLPTGSKLPSVREMASGKGSFVCAKDGVDETRKNELLGKFDELVTELGYIGVDKPQLIERLKGE